MAQQSAEKLGQYQLVQKIAQGGMAEVFKAQTADAGGLQRLVVIKRILPHISADPDYVSMLVDEAKIAVHFNHGNIAQVYDLGRVGQDYFIVMEYVDGKTISHINKEIKRRQQTFPLDILLYCFIEVCHGLSYIHKREGPDGAPLGVVHRDVSPQNIILSYAGNIKIIDFGVAKARYRKGKTESGVLKGKFAYMSPEQARSDRIDHRSDIFSVGILLWEMSTGLRLFKRATNHETVQAVQKAKFEPASNFREDLPKDFDKIIKKALQRTPKSRYQDAADMAVDLEKLLFKINPDFKPIKAVEFIYKIFGPEDDEADLPDQLFDKELTPAIDQTRKMPFVPTGEVIEPEEPTLKDIEKDIEDEEFTPVSPLAFDHGEKPWSYSRLIFAVAVLFFLGSLWVYKNQKPDTGVLKLTGLSTDMKVYINDGLIKDSKHLFTVEALVSHRLIVVLDEREFEANFTVEPGAVKKIAVKFEKKAEQVVLSDLLVRTTPPGATVYLNNQEWPQKTPVKIQNLDSTLTYKLGLYIEGASFHSQVLSLKPGEEKLLHIVLEKD